MIIMATETVIKVIHALRKAVYFDSDMISLFHFLTSKKHLKINSFVQVSSKLGDVQNEILACS
jgi:hypothetical protein